MAAPSQYSTSGLCATHSERNEVEIRSKSRGGNVRHIGKLPRRLLDLNDDDDLYGLEAEVRLMDARVGDLLDKLPEDSVLDVLTSIETKLAAIEISLAAVSADEAGIDKPSAYSLLTDLRKFLDGVKDDRRTWRDIIDITEQRRKLVESERKRAVEAQQIITQRQATMMLQHILEIIHRHVHDRTAKASIAADIEKLARNGTINRTLV